VIDLTSQHPFASEFLRKDVSNVTDFFSKRGLPNALTRTELFNFIVDKEFSDPDYLVKWRCEGEALTSSESCKETVQGESNSRSAPARLGMEEMRAYLSFLMSVSGSRRSSKPTQLNRETARQRGGPDELEGGGEDEMVDSADVNNTTRDALNAAQEEEEEEEGRRQVDEAVFMQAFIPSSLHDFSNPYAEADRLRRGMREPVFEAAVSKMLGEPVVAATYVEDSAGDNEDSDEKQSVDNLSSSEDEDEEDEEEGDGDDDSQDDGPHRYRKQLPSRTDPTLRLKEKEARKEARKAAKAAQAEKRQHKIPKHLKKKAVKANKK
jgi:RIO kinase 1